MENNRRIVKALPDNASVKVQLNGRKRNIIWDALYAARASGRNSDKPGWELAREQIMASMRVIDQHHPVETPAEQGERRRRAMEQRMRRI